MLLIYSIEWHSESTGFSIGSSMEESIVVYRSLILLNQLHNTVFGTHFVPMVKLCGVLILYIAVFTTTVLRSAIGPIFFAMFLLYVIALVIIIIPGAVVMSQVYNISTKFRHAVETSIINNISYTQAEERHLLRKTL